MDQWHIFRRRCQSPWNEYVGASALGEKAANQREAQSTADHRKGGVVNFEEQNQLRVQVAYDFARMPGCFGVWIHARGNGEYYHAAEPLTMVKTSVSCGSNPAFHLTKDQALELLNRLWELGLRPTTPGALATAGQLESTVRHLEDMRQLVFKKDLQPIDRVKRT